MHEVSVLAFCHCTKTILFPRYTLSSSQSSSGGFLRWRLHLDLPRLYRCPLIGSSEILPCFPMMSKNNCSGTPISECKSKLDHFVIKIDVGVILVGFWLFRHTFSWGLRDVPVWHTPIDPSRTCHLYHVRHRGRDAFHSQSYRLSVPSLCRRSSGICGRANSLDLSAYADGEVFATQSRSCRSSAIVILANRMTRQKCASSCTFNKL